MTSSHTGIMEHNNNSKFHVLSTSWSLWAHLPQNPDWTQKGYEFIHKYQYIEDTIAITETLPELLVKNLKVPDPAAKGIVLFKRNRISKEEYCATPLSYIPS